jgi:hypothetical protein
LLRTRLLTNCGCSVSGRLSDEEILLLLELGVQLRGDRLQIPGDVRCVNLLQAPCPDSGLARTEAWPAQMMSTPLLGAGLRVTVQPPQRCSTNTQLKTHGIGCGYKCSKCQMSTCARDSEGIVQARGLSIHGEQPEANQHKSCTVGESSTRPRESGPVLGSLSQVQP